MSLGEVYFHTKQVQDADRCDTSVPILLNCGGLEYYHAPFLREDTRKDFGLVYIISGEMDMYTEKNIHTLSNGYFFIAPPHAHKTKFGTSARFLSYYWLNFTGAKAEQLIQSCGLEYYHPYNIGSCEAIADCFKQLFGEFLIDDCFFSLRSEAYLTTLLTEVARKSLRPAKAQLKTIKHIHAHYNKNLCTKALAEMENFSYPHYYHVFKRATGMSPQEYINMQRINAACFLLTDTAHTISEISASVGYADACYFSRIFKKKTGVSPQQYRKSSQNQ